MSKNEKIKFNDLENVFGEKSPEAYSDEELLGVIRSPNLLAERGKTEQILIVGTILEKMQSSEDFKRRVLEEIEKSRP